MSLSGPSSYLTWCPRCEALLEEHACRYWCRVCGYFADCED